jgi:hypothetical protein
MSRKLPWPCVATLLSLGLLCACSDDSHPAGPSGPGGNGGTGLGGAGGGAGVGGAGGRLGSGSGGSGGAAGGSGGAAGGSGGAAGGSGGAAGGSAGAAGGSGGTGGSPADGGSPTGDPSAALDECFVGLRMLSTMNQIATKRSADGRYAVRIALEYPPGRVGTSGTVPWAAIRFAIVAPQGQLCIKDETALREPYKGSRHNCSDVFTITSNGVTYQLKYPDTTPERPDTILSVTGAAAVPPVTLATVSCQSQSGGQCLSGGPCN